MRPSYTKHFVSQFYNCLILFIAHVCLICNYAVALLKYINDIKHCNKSQELENGMGCRDTYWGSWGKRIPGIRFQNVSN